MSFVSAELLIEYVLRVGVDDLLKDPTIAERMFFANKHLKEGRNLTATGGPEVYESLIMDHFQARLLDIPKRSGETGKPDIFVNSIPNVPDVNAYLQQANVRIVHGYPRESQDLPAITINIANEDEEPYIGTHKHEITDSATGVQYEAVGSDFSAQYAIQILTPNYDETMVWYHIIKHCLMVYRPVFEAYGFRETRMSWQDPEPAPEYLQGGLFVYQRTCLLMGKKDEWSIMPKDGFSELVFGLATPDGPIDGGKSIIPGEDELDAGEYPEV